jgi:thiol-disulfide isomerase/thioredoxin
MCSAARRAVKVRVAWILPFLLALPAPSFAKATRSPDTIAAVSTALGDSIPVAGHVVYLDFWASWCTPCRASFPWMAALQARYRERGLEIVTVNLDQDPAAAGKFLAVMKSPLRVVRDADGSLAKRYDLEVMPTSFVYGRDGKLRTRHEGFHPREADSMESLIKTLLEEK